MNNITAAMPVWILNEEGLQLTRVAIGVGNVPLIVVDNASQMGGGFLRSRADVYIRNRENLGYAAAVNQAIKLTRTKYLAVVSNDTAISLHWREVAEEIFNSNSDIFSVHFRMTDYGVPFAYGNQVVPTGKERWCTAAFFVLDVEKALKCDLLFDENFFNSFEDWDLFFRAREAGFKTVYTDKACFQHMHSFTQKLVGFPKTEKNKEYFFKKHGEDPDAKFARLYPEQVALDYQKGFDI